MAFKKYFCYYAEVYFKLLNLAWTAEFFVILVVRKMIAATLPVTTMTAERTFSIMKRIETYLRSTITTDRLTGLVHIYTLIGSACTN